MRYAVCFEIEAESASEAVGAIKKMDQPLFLYPKHHAHL